MIDFAWMEVLSVFVASLLVVAWSHPIVRKVAVKRNIMDNPDARKLQKESVPVMGGVAVFFGLITGLCIEYAFINISGMLPIFIAMSLMLCVGVMDDVSGLSPWLRFLIEILVVVMLIFSTKISLNSLHGLWGVYDLPMWLSVPLTIVAIVGIINAINLIDGVDGLSSGFCMMTSVAFGIFFYKCGNISMLLFCAISLGSLMPFFFHNVFGNRSKMFIGDGGTLMMGVVMSTYVVTTIASRDVFLQSVSGSAGLVAFTMAVMAVPVFDTLRVMLMRILRGVSPFSPDKTHLHHLFIDLGFSHIGTTLSVLFLNFLVILSWWISYELGATVEVQFYVVVICGFTVTAAFYKFMRLQISSDTKVAQFMRRVGRTTHFESRKSWQALQRCMDLRK